MIITNNICILSKNSHTTKLCIKNKVSITYRNFPGGKEFGHAAKVANALANNISKIPKSNLNTIGSVKEKLPILIPPKVNEPNYIVEKYLPLYTAQNLQIPFVRNKFPSQGLPGAITIPDDKRNFLTYDNAYTQEVATLQVRYFCILYGGKPVETYNDILNRIQQVFSIDSVVSQGLQEIAPYSFNQHYLSQDTYGLSAETKQLVLPVNMNLSQRFISLTKYNELNVIQKTHKFLFEENRDEILIIDENNSKHIKLLEDNVAVIKPIVKQPYPELLGIGLNKKVVYAIDAKLIGNPEVNLPMLSSYSSISPNYRVVEAATKMKGTLMNQYNKITNKNDLFAIQRSDDIQDLNKLLHKIKGGKLLLQNAVEDYKEYCINTFKTQRAFGTFIYDNMSFAPSIIAEGPISNNYYTELQKNNPLLLENMERDVIKHFNFEKRFPKLKDMKSFDCYSTTLEDMIFLQRFNMLDNYYKFRQILSIDDYV